MRDHIGWVLALALAGCVPGGGGGGSDGDGTIEDDGGPDTRVAQDGAVDRGPRDAGPTDGAPDLPPAQPGAPRILSLRSDADRITEGESVTLSAVVTDDDGVDDVIGGVLETPDGRSLGAFEATGPGTFRAVVDWRALHRARPIEFFGEQPRSVWARFFDQAGLEGVGSVELTLYCAGGGACDGVCADLLGDSLNCGGCGVVCPPVGDGQAICVGGDCGGECADGGRLCGAECFDTATDPAHCGGCDRACPAVLGGEATCVDGACGGRCPGGGEVCDGACVDVQTDLAHCGACGAPCPGDGSRCVGGGCVPPCAPGELVCLDACVDPMSDDAHCGDCGEACPAGTICQGGRCAVPCGGDSLACGGRCAACPETGVAEVGCDGTACVATDCLAGYEVSSGGCAERGEIWVSTYPAQRLRGGIFPPIDLDLAFDRDGAPRLALGAILRDDDIRVSIGRGDAEAWRFEAVDVFGQGWDAMRVGLVPLADGRLVIGYGYGRNEAGVERLGGGIVVRAPDGDARAAIPGNLGGSLWNFSTAAAGVGGALDAQISLSIDNPFNRAVSRYRWNGAGLDLLEPHIGGIVVHALDRDGTAHFAYQADFGEPVTWRRGADNAGRLVEPVGEGAALLGAIRVGPLGPVIAYSREPDAILRIARRVNGQWQRETVDPAAVGGQFEGYDLELDADGWPVLCYWRSRTFWTARLGPGGWTRAPTIAVPGGISRCAVAPDPAGGVSIAVAHMQPIGDLFDTRVTYHGLAAPAP